VIVRLASSTLVLALALVASSTAVAQPRIAAVVAPARDADVRTATLVGPSGQLYLGDGSGRWARRAAGGIAADVTAALRSGADLIVAGPATPLYRFDGSAWSAHKLGQSGRIVVGRGPVPAVAIGKHIFLEKPADPRNKAARPGWIRIGEAIGPIIALWAASPRKVLVVTAAGVHALRGRELVRTGAAVDAIVGDVPWGITADGATNLARARDSLPAAGTIAATAGATAPYLLTTDGTTLRLVGRTPAGPISVDVPVTAGAAIAGLVADHTGRVLVVTADGELHVYADNAWTSGTLVDELPAPRPGPGPAPTS
jgi:hypothetical protein